MRTKKYLLLALLYSFCIEANSESCKFYPNHKLTAISITLPAISSIARDAPTGTVIYESPPVTFFGDSSYECKKDIRFGIKNLVGPDLPGRLFPIGDTGIAWQWLLNDIPVPGVVTGYPQAAGGKGFNGMTNAIRFVKAGNINNNARIPSGTLGTFNIETLSTLSIHINGMSVAVPSCETPDVLVDMGEYDISEFSNNHSPPNPRHFSIKLNNCPTGINKVNYRLSTTTTAPAINPNQGVISLNKSSTAKGIALQIMDGNQQPVRLDTPYTFSDYSSTGGNFSIPFSARYVTTSSNKSLAGDRIGVRAGSANTEIIFIMSYL